MQKEIFYYFLRFGVFGFGGPLALISNMQKDLIEKRKWIDTEEFNSAFSLIKAMPGPVAFMTAVYLGKPHSHFGSKNYSSRDAGLCPRSYSWFP